MREGCCAPWGQMDTEISARTGASVKQPFPWFYGQEDEQNSWEKVVEETKAHGNKSRSTNIPATPGRVLARDALRPSPPFFKGTQVSSHIILAPPEITFYHTEKEITSKIKPEKEPSR